MPAVKKPMTKTQIITEIAEKADLTKVQAKTALEALTELAYKQAKLGFTIPGIGKLVIKKTPKRAAREGINPATGEKIQIAAKPAGKKLAFRIAKAAKDAVL